MKLIVFHKVLIISAIVFFIGYGVYELYRYAIPGDTPGATSDTALDALVTPDDSSGRPVEALWTGLAMLGGAAALSGYLWWLWRRPANVGPAAQ